MKLFARRLKNEIKPHLRKQWVIPPVESAAFVYQMEAVLDLYQQPYDPRRPLVCLDEKPVSLHSHVRTPLSAKPGVPRRIESLARLAQEAKAWQTPRNRTGKPGNWWFTTEDARIKLRRLYPSIDD